MWSVHFLEQPSPFCFLWRGIMWLQRLKNVGDFFILTFFPISLFLLFLKLLCSHQQHFYLEILSRQRFEAYIHMYFLCWQQMIWLTKNQEFLKDHEKKNLKKIPSVTFSLSEWSKEESVYWGCFTKFDPRVMCCPLPHETSLAVDDNSPFVALYWTSWIFTVPVTLSRHGIWFWSSETSDFW